MKIHFYLKLLYISYPKSILTHTQIEWVQLLIISELNAHLKSI